jgi:CubicO group peptidase (beta-lactamase class C family)
MREELFESLGMEHSNFFPQEAILRRHCVGHFLDEREAFQVAKPWAFARATGPIGRVNSTVRDMLKYARMHLEGGHGVLSPESVRAMQQPSTQGQLDDEFGLTWWLRDYFDSDGKKVRTILHGGAANGQMSAFWLVPSKNFACVILTNAQKGVYLHGELSAWVNEHFLGLKIPQACPVNAGEDQLRQYVGRYVGHAFGTAVEIYLQDGTLSHRVVPGDTSSVTTTPVPPLPPARLELLEGERLRIAEGDAQGGKLEILRGADGQIEWLRTGGRLYAPQS